MDAIQKTSNDLHERVQSTTLNLLKRFEAIVALSPLVPPPSDSDNQQPPPQQSRTRTAVEGYEIEVQTTALVRAAEDLLGLVRGLKEAWLFGQLNSVLDVDGGEREVGGKLEEDVKTVERVLEGMMKEENA